MNRSRHARLLLPGPRVFRFVMAGLLAGPLTSMARLPAQQPPAAQPPLAETEPETDRQPSSVDTPEPEVRFAFTGVPWREVIDWIAEEANLALHIDGVPAGSFTYSDPSSFTHQQAIDRINLFLLPQGYTLVRSGNLLSVINLSDPRSLQQLDALAELIRAEELPERTNHDVVKCLFPLGALSAEEAVEELGAIKLMMTPAVFKKTNQLMVTDTVAKLKNVKAILDSFEPSKLDNGTIVKSFPLQYAEAEDVLLVARPHLGLATGEMIGIDVSLSADLEGKNIFVTGIEDKVKLIEKLVESIDVPTPSLTDGETNAKFQTHVVAGGNVDLAYDVLQTLLAGKDVRISKDDTAGTIVALAPPSIQEEIAMTVEQMAADEAQFEVIQLKSVDPYVAIALIEQMLDLTLEFDSGDRRDRDRDRDEKPLPPPKIDADPENRRLFVRGRPAQIAEIKQIVEGIDQKQNATASNESIRLLPLTGDHAKQSLVLAARFWRLPNPIVFFESDESMDSARRERVAFDSDDPSADQRDDFLDALESKTPAQFVSVSDRGRLLQTPSPDVTKAAIECQLTTRGLLIQCDDIDVLNQFQDHLETLAGPGTSIPAEPVVFYLKFTRPEDAIRMLAELLDGGQAVASSSDTLVNASISSPSSSFLGSLVTNREGTMTLIAGTATVVADSRLNRLIVQGTVDDVELIENYLQIIEKDSSITSIETYGTSHIIELENSKAVEVEAAIRQAFAGRVAAATGAPGAPGGGASRADVARNEQQESGKDKKSDGKNQAPKPAAQQARDLEPKMTLAVHEPSNSLIVTAPDPLFKDVEALVKTIDVRGEQMIQVITPSNSEVLETVLQEIFLGQSDGRSRSSSRTSTRTTSSRSPYPANGKK
ncbi:Bacterial type II/III secretion system short domain protein [Stieleria neptunia]|uniref:Bacterial type II/III secretion system short domain protein n=1 Tax=Stieleria neptunia TaxID=2527979 RepID=A0A518I1S0_9BACT|nr:secretin N-terminal domain-containing protein [Stieleria neptunia]QDV47006.1 Bacterial type II/III secretion system short domain protein [Stieleria neptunia]